MLAVASGRSGASSSVLRGGGGPCLLRHICLKFSLRAVITKQEKGEGLPPMFPLQALEAFFLLVGKLAQAERDLVLLRRI